MPLIPKVRFPSKPDHCSPRGAADKGQLRPQRSIAVESADDGKAIPLPKDLHVGLDIKLQAA